MLKAKIAKTVMFFLFCFSVESACWAQEARQQPSPGVINGTVQGPIRLVSDTVLSGIATGPITVGSGVTLYLSGIAHGLVIEAGGRVIISGIVKGAVINNGGYVQVSGVVDFLQTTLGGTTRILRGAYVNGVRQEF